MVRVPKMLTLVNRDRKKPKHYQYKPLPTEHHTRLVKLLPGEGDAEICCLMEFKTINDVEDTYDAISYAWGDATNTVKIQCNKRELEVTASLADALRAIRDPKQAKWIWADAICINQKDSTEKGHQVTFMGKIYEKAKEVFVWLGKDDEGIAKDCYDLIRDTVQYLNDRMEDYDNVMEIPYVDVCTTVTTDSRRWANIPKLVSLPWFKRLWVVQEAALAKSCSLVWGNQILTISDLFEIALWASWRTDLFTGKTLSTGFLVDLFIFAHCTYENDRTWRTKHVLIKEQQSAVRGWEWSFLHVLNAGRALRVTNDVDRIFAFLGNPQALRDLGGASSTKLLVEPDYNKSVDKVYFDAACSFLKDPKLAPGVLLMVAHKSNGKIKAKDFPSWVPRWDNGFRHSALGDPDHWYRAGGKEKFEVLVNGQEKSLSLKGVIFDRITWISDQISEENMGFNTDEWDDDLIKAQEPYFDRLWKNALEHINSSREFPITDIEKLEAEFCIALNLGYPAAVEPSEAKIRRALADLPAYREVTRTLAKSNRAGNVLLQLDPRDIERALRFYNKFYYVYPRRLAITASGRFGMVAWFCKPGDVCFVSPGLALPVLLRPRDGQRYNFVGDSFINGAMSGQIIKGIEEGKYTEETVIIK